MRWWRGSACCVYVLGRVLLARGCCHNVLWHDCVVCVLLSRQFLRRQCRPASVVHVYCGVRLDERDIERVRDDNRNVCDMSRR